MVTAEHKPAYSLDQLGAVILMANASNVDTVIVGGKILKRDGRLVGVDFKQLLRMADSSRDRIMEAALKRGPLVPPPESAMMTSEKDASAKNLVGSE